MGFKTLSGYLPANVQANGIINFGTSPYDVPTANDWKNTFADTYGLAYHMQMPGVLSGGVCTVSALNVTVPSGTIYYAEQVWITDSAVVQGVPDGTGLVTYLWGCSDWQVRQVATLSALACL